MKIHIPKTEKLYAYINFTLETYSAYSSYSSTTNYLVNDITEYNGKFYRCIEPCIDVLPTDETKWLKILNALRPYVAPFYENNIYVKWEVNGLCHFFKLKAGVTTSSDTLDLIEIDLDETPLSCTRLPDGNGSAYLYSAFEYTNDWKSTIYYGKNEFTKHNGIQYFAKAPSKNIEPGTNGDIWMDMMQVGVANIPGLTPYYLISSLHLSYAHQFEEVKQDTFYFYSNTRIFAKDEVTIVFCFAKKSGLYDGYWVKYFKSIVDNNRGNNPFSDGFWEELKTPFDPLNVYDESSLTYQNGFSNNSHYKVEFDTSDCESICIKAKGSEALIEYLSDEKDINGNYIVASSETKALTKSTATTFSELISKAPASINSFTLPVVSTYRTRVKIDVADETSFKAYKIAPCSIYEPGMTLVDHSIEKLDFSKKSRDAFGSLYLNPGAITYRAKFTISIDEDEFEYVDAFIDTYRAKLLFWEYKPGKIFYGYIQRANLIGKKDDNYEFELVIEGE